MIDEAKRIVDALRCCTDGYCDECNYRHNKQDCQSEMERDAAELIERLSKRVEELESEVEYWEDLAEGRASD